MTNPGTGAQEIRQLARYQVRPESLGRCLKSVHEYVAAMRAGEPGMLRYDVWQELGDPTRFVHLFVLRDTEAEAVHNQSPDLKKFVDILTPECVGRIEFTEYRQIASL